MLRLLHYRRWGTLKFLAYLVPCLVFPWAVVKLSFVLGSNNVLGLLLSPGLVAIIWKWPETSLALIPFTFLFGEGLHSSLQVIPRQVTWLSDVVIMILASRLLFAGKWGKVEDPLRLPLIVLLVIFVISTLLNSVRPFIALVAMRNYFKYAILYIAITRLPITSQSISYWLRFLFALVARLVEWS